MKIAFLFPGQGSQSVGMGADLAAHIPSSLKVFEEASLQIGYKLDSVCFYGPADKLSSTEITQPALFTVSAAALNALTEQGVTAEAAAGHSVGEYSALLAAGAIDFSTALRLVTQRGHAMNRAAMSHPGTMSAVLGLASDAVEDVCREVTETGIGLVVAANFNGAGQVVISGVPAAVEKAGAALKARGAKKVIPLAVSGSFHSPLMKTAAEEMKVYLEGAGVESAKIPVVANATADYETSASQIVDNLVAQVDGPVRWEQSIVRLLNDDFDTFVEVGSGSVLSSLVKRIAKNIQVFSVSDSAGVAAAAAALRK